MRIAPRLRLIFISIIAVQRIAAAAEEEPRAALDEIIVTAQKREERLQDVPIAIVAVSGANLRNEGVRNLSDLNSSIPDVHVSQAFAQGYLSIRGLSSGINPGFESTVGQVIDGYFYPRDRFAYLSFLDIDRIEILKGPQGALIGKNTTAGAINITTAKPTKTFQGSVDVEREMEGDPGWTEEAAVSGPLVDTLKGRIAIRDEDHDGYLARLVSGGREPTRNDKYGRATLQWDPTDRLDVILSAARAEIDEHGRNLELIYCAPSFRGSLAAKGLSQYEDCQRNWRTGENYGRPALGPGQYDLERTTADIYTLTAALKTPWGTLSALSGYAAFDFLGQESGLRTAIDTRAVDLGEDWKQMSEEVRLVSNPGGRFDYILGGYFLNSRQGTLDQIDIFGVRGFSAPIVAHVSSNTYAGFGNLVWHATDTFDATLEGRYTQENKSAHLQENTSPLFQTSVITVNNYDIALARSEGDFTPGARLVWRPQRDLMVYGSWNKGFKGGGFNDFLAAANNAQARQLAEFGPEKVNAYELGSKWTFAEGTAELNAALFRTDSKDLQVTALIPGGVLTAFAVENAASARNQGAEVELNWRPIQSLVLGARTAYLDAKYSNFSDSQCFGGETATQGCVNGVQSLSGQQLPFSPKFAATLDAEYTWHLVGQWSIAAFVQASYSQSYWTEFVDDPASRQGSYTKYNARLALRSNHLDLALIGRNLSNVYTFAGASQINPAAAGGTADAATIDPPRELILQLRYHF